MLAAFFFTVATATTVAVAGPVVVVVESMGSAAVSPVHWADTLGVSSNATVPQRRTSVERTSKRLDALPVSRLSLTSHASAAVRVHRAMSDLPWDSTRKRISRLGVTNPDVPAALLELLLDDDEHLRYSMFEEGAAVVNATVDICLGSAGQWNRESCPSAGVHVTVCVAHRDGDDTARATFAAREQDARLRLARFGKKAAGTLGVWPLEFLHDDTDEVAALKDHRPEQLSRQCRDGRRDVSCGATPLYRQMATLSLSPPVLQHKYRVVDKLGGDETRSLGRAHGDPSRPFCFVSTSLNPFNMCTDTVARILRLLYPRDFAESLLEDDMESLEPQNRAAESHPEKRPIVELADQISDVKAALHAAPGAHVQYFGSTPAADDSAARQSHALRRSSRHGAVVDAASRIAEVLRSTADGLHASLQVRRLVSPALRYDAANATVEFVSDVSLHSYYSATNAAHNGIATAVAPTKKAESHLTSRDTFHVDGLMELRGEAFGRLRVRLDVPRRDMRRRSTTDEGDEDDEVQGNTRVGVIDMVVRWPALLFRPYLRSVRLARVRGAEGRSAGEDFLANESEARIRSRSWTNFSSWAHPCFSNPITIGTVQGDPTLVTTLVRIGVVNTAACRAVIATQDRLAVDALVDFDFRHLHADEYAPDMNRYYATPAVIARLRGERQLVGTAWREAAVRAPWAATMGPWIDSYVANAAESGALSPTETNELVKHLLATYVHRDWQEDAWAISSDAGLYVNPPIPDRAMPFNALALWATVLAITMMTAMNVGVRGNPGKLWGESYAAEVKAAVQADELALR